MAIWIELRCERRGDGMAEGYAKAMETLAAPSIKTKHKPAA